jgi:PAS domain S-box-containing protein
MNFISEKMERFAYFRAIVISLIISFAQSVYSQDTIPGKKKILILHTVEEERPWNILYNKSFKNALKNDSIIDADVFIEYLDLVRNNSDEYKDILEKLIRTKYQIQPPDIIVVTQIEAVNFVFDRNIFPEIPKILVQITDENSGNYSNSTTITVGFNFDAKLKHALSIFPQTKEIYVIVGKSKVDTHALKNFKTETRLLNEQVSFKYLDNLTSSEILDSIKNLPDNSIVYYLSYTQDLTGKAIMARDFSFELAKHCNRPVFTFLDLLSEETGIFGGMVISLKSDAQKTVDVIKQVFNGVDIESISPIITDQAYVYDWNELKRWNVDIQKLPKESVFYNRKYTFMEEYKKEVIGGVILLLSYTILLIMLLYSNVNKKISEKKLQLQNADYELLNSKYKSQNELLRIEKARTEESEAKFRGLFDKVADAIFAYNPENFEILEANTATAKIYGYDKEELIGMSCLKFSADIENSILVAHNIRQNGNATVNIRHHKKKDGTNIFVELNGYKITVNEKEVFFSVCKDITDKLKAEQALSRSEIKFRALFEQSGGYCMILDPNTKNGIPIIIDANEAACTNQGYSRTEIIGKPLAQTDNEEEQKLVKERTALIMTGKPFYSESIHTRQDGTFFHVAVNATRIDIEGEPPLIFTTEYDISERKKTELELIKAKEKAEESDRLKSAFLANMSHEIRTPMNGILGFTSLLKSPELSGEKQQKYIAIIEKSGMRMLSTIQDIINISRIEAGQTEISLSEVNVNEELQYLYEFFKPEVLTKGIEFTFDYGLSASKSTIKTDKEKLLSILTNLLKNAIKFTHNGTISLDYRLDKSNEIPELIFKIKDTGIGIPTNRQNAIFDRFVQADIEDKQVYEGSGLGLTISKAFVEMLGGKLWLESKEGSGSTFYFTIPYKNLIEAKNDSQTDIATIIPDKIIDPKVSGIKILIAEDDETSANFLALIIENFGREILKSKTGQETIDIYHNNPDIDLILLDIKMPDLNGYEVARHIRKTNTDVVIIAQTAYSLTGDKEKAIEVGCNEYITKPINKIELWALLQKHFKTH